MGLVVEKVVGRNIERQACELAVDRACLGRGRGDQALVEDTLERVELALAHRLEPLRAGGERDDIGNGACSQRRRHLRPVGVIREEFRGDFDVWIGGVELRDVIVPPVHIGLGDGDQPDGDIGLVRRDCAEARCNESSHDGACKKDTARKDHRGKSLARGWSDRRPEHHCPSFILISGLYSWKRPCQRSRVQPHSVADAVTSFDIQRRKAVVATYRRAMGCGVPLWSRTVPSSGLSDHRPL